MSKNKIILILGIFIAILPFLGLPSSWIYFLVFVSGVAVAVISYLTARGNRLAFFKTTKHKEEVITEVFVEKDPRNENKEQITVIDIESDNFSGNNE
jgi:hypothetical protein